MRSICRGAVRQRTQRPAAPTLSPQRVQKGGSTRGIWSRHSAHNHVPTWPQLTQRGGNKRSRNWLRRLNQRELNVSMINTGKEIHPRFCSYLNQSTCNLMAETQGMLPTPPKLPKMSPIDITLITAGPSRTTKIDGKMKKTMAGNILMPAERASPSAR